MLPEQAEAAVVFFAEVKAGKMVVQPTVAEGQNNVAALLA